MNECMLATKQLSAPYNSRERNSSSSSHGDYSSFSQAMRSPPTLQPSIQPPQPPSYQGSSSILPRPMPNGIMPGATATTATLMAVPTTSPRAKPVQETAEISKPPPKKRGRPSRADRAKKELRPLLPQHLMPRPPPMDYHSQQQHQHQHQSIYQSGMYYPPPPLTPALAMQDARPTTHHRLSPEPGRSTKKQRRGSTPDRLPPVGDIIGTPKSREED
ncbi:hypothetical protein ISF_01837 [Cordyceps fumosorosea ARSEF 2679]|uniref:Uncharacterized protein n=1 Tax=Cordyceps fumosorosea (strain ARSEF 2679) TaxID=1081104 RepID=A0A168CEM2_CORFA|nr:hypothetical protein ISF_01837 [Cordyceps fumosorosea ARSEF 2679]OAA71286.1 hypothetical protein ISF_01837 [Cordyceps fumosorosea ARSEF 2679]